MYGTFTLSYQPPAEATSEEASVEMSFSSEVDLNSVLKHFENFLRANGYPLDFEDSLEVSHSSKNEEQTPSLNFDPYFDYWSDSVEFNPGESSVSFITMDS